MARSLSPRWCCILSSCWSIWICHREIIILWMENILMIMIARSVLRGMEQIQMHSNFSKPHVSKDSKEMDGAQESLAHASRYPWILTSLVTKNYERYTVTIAFCSNRSQFVQSVLAQCLVELSSARSTFRFTIQGQDGKVYILVRKFFIHFFMAL